ncbi:PAS domain-containing protein [Methylobacterium sp. E-065]|uniref:histidine kinase dimerization/phosphoacceptor domain -containing protein n=1 Tax=Methylobacterium sp. E-065 TaxID=2836583 RepID=UPI001FBAA611|nr:histidine kinase dimerization/phosphoacceptor domain -containing protein [Methylobacterium sp. E-065]MCJ2018947.1 PAS domain-containing protein [Methylobacterium sp. E-065]
MEADEAWRLTDRLQAEHGKGDPFAAAIRATRMAMVITDPRLPDNPIVFVNDAFLRMTGYDRAEVMGVNCRFLQGPGTDGGDVLRIREAVEGQRDIAVDLLNYRKDGTTFWNALYMSPVVNEAGDLLYFFASQLDVTDRIDADLRIRTEKAEVERQVAERTRELTQALESRTILGHEVDHRVKNNLQVIASLLGMEARAMEDPRARLALRTMQERVEALGTVHKQLYQEADATRFDVAECARAIATDLVQASGRADIHLSLDAEAALFPAAKAQPVALMLNEVIREVLRPAIAAEGEGSLGVVTRPDGRDVRVEVIYDGTGRAEAPSGSGLVGRLIKSLSRQLDADVEWLPMGRGTRVSIRLPHGPVAEATSA